MIFAVLIRFYIPPCRIPLWEKPQNWCRALSYIESHSKVPPSRRDVDAVERNKPTHRTNSDALHLRFPCYAWGFAHVAAVLPHSKGPHWTLLQVVSPVAHRERK